MKICKTCQRKLSDNDFYIQTQRGKNGQTWKNLDSYCKDCRRQYQTDRRREIKKQAIEYLGGRCKHCGLETAHYEVYDFHHQDPNGKDYSVGQNSKCFETIKKELDKCVLLCSNCHRIEHYKIEESGRDVGLEAATVSISGAPG